MTWGEPAPIGVVGTGLIGASIAMAAARAGIGVRGFDPDAEILKSAAERSGLEPVSSPGDCARGASVVFVCTPVAAIAEVAMGCLRADGDALVTDVGSVKANVLAQVEASVDERDRSRFVGGHPMAGSERAGPEAASASLLEGSVWVLTPAPWTAPGSVERLSECIERLGAHPVSMDAERHDRLVALVSHLPQVLSSALMALAAAEEATDPNTLKLAAGGFRDLTRLAASDPELWVDILGTNREAVAEAIDRYVEWLLRVRGLLREGTHDELRRILQEARRARTELGAKPQVLAGMAVLQMPVPDRPGVLAEITAALGSRDVNIEDLQIVHSPWGPSGVVHVTVIAELADAALEELSARGYEAIRVA